MAYRDMVNKTLKAGDLVAGSFREGNTAVLRTGIVQKLGVTHDPQVMEGEPGVDVAWVLWTDTSGHFLPKKMTRVACRKVAWIND